jgi:predicted DNA-binding ribbon-helix-helix protein
VSQAIKKRSVEIAGHRTSLTLEQAFWRALKRLAAREAGRESGSSSRTAS